MTNEQVALLEKAIGDGSDFPDLTNDPIVNFNIDLEMGLFDDEPEITSWDDLDEEEQKTYIEEAASIGSE